MRKTNLCLSALAVALAAAGAARADGPAPAATPTTVATPNLALTATLPPGWSAKPIKNGLALEPPPPAGKKTAFDETIVLACEPFGVKSLEDEAKVEDLLARLRAGQLASLDEDRRWHRERMVVGEQKTALVVSYEGTDDSGMPAALRVAILPDEGRVAILTARMPLRRMPSRSKDLDAILASVKIVPHAAEKELLARLVGKWGSAAAPGVTLDFKANGIFEESRQKTTNPGVYEVVGREVRLRFDDGAVRAFRVDEEPAPGSFVSGGQLWKRE